MTVRRVKVLSTSVIDQDSAKSIVRIPPNRELGPRDFRLDDDGRTLRGRRVRRRGVVFALVLTAMAACSQPASNEVHPQPTVAPDSSTGIRSAAIPTCAPNGRAWARDACPESVWVRKVVAAAGGRILRVTDGIEPQRSDAFVVDLDGWRYSFGAISALDFRRMGGYWSMGEFAAGMANAGSVSGIRLSGSRRSGHWSWFVNGFTAQVYPLVASGAPTEGAPRPVIAKLVTASAGLG